MAISEFLDELERDAVARRRLARLLAAELASDSELRLAVINAVLRDVATKGDLERLGRELEGKIEAVKRELEARIEALEARLETLEERITRLEERIDRLEAELRSMLKWVVGLLASIWATIVVLLLPILLRMLASLPAPG